MAEQATPRKWLPKRGYQSRAQNSIRVSHIFCEERPRSVYEKVTRAAGRLCSYLLGFPQEERQLERATEIEDVDIPPVRTRYAMSGRPSRPPPHTRPKSEFGTQTDFPPSPLDKRERSPSPRLKKRRRGKHSPPPQSLPPAKQAIFNPQHIERLKTGTCTSQRFLKRLKEVRKPEPSPHESDLSCPNTPEAIDLPSPARSTSPENVAFSRQSLSPPPAPPALPPATDANLSKSRGAEDGGMASKNSEGIGRKSLFGPVFGEKPEVRSQTSLTEKEPSGSISTGNEPQTAAIPSAEPTKASSELQTADSAVKEAAPPTKDPPPPTPPHPLPSEDAMQVSIDLEKAISPKPHKAELLNSPPISLPLSTISSPTASLVSQTSNPFLSPATAPVAQYQFVFGQTSPEKPSTPPTLFSPIAGFGQGSGMLQPGSGGFMQTNPFMTPQQPIGGFGQGGNQPTVTSFEATSPAVFNSGSSSQGGGFTLGIVKKRGGTKK